MTEILASRRGRKGMTPAARKISIKQAARQVLSTWGILGLTQRRVADAAGVSVSLVAHHLGTSDAMREWAVEDAMTNGDTATKNMITAQLAP